MKKLLICLFLQIFFYSLYSQDYPIPCDNCQYGYINVYGPPGLPGSGKYGYLEDTIQLKDTIINSIVYKKEGYAYFRNENLKTYVIDSAYSNQELLLYDFNLEVGDTFIVPIWNNEANVTSKFFIELLNGEQRIVIEIDYGSSIGMWIQGIGDVHNSLFYFQNINLYDIYTYIPCFADETGWIYEMSDLPCQCDSLNTYIESWNKLSSVNEKSNNLFYDKSNKKIIFVDAYNYIIYNTLGVIVKQGAQQEVSIKDLDRGVYFIVINNERIQKIMID